MSDLIPAGSVLLHTAFIGVVLLIAVLFVLGRHRAALSSGITPPLAVRGTLVTTVLVAAWLGVTAGLAQSGTLRFANPPTMPLLILAGLVLTIAIGRSRIGARFAAGIPLAALVGFQGFRVLVELILHRAYVEGLMPVQMSYSGRNFDIITGVTAIPLGFWLARGGGSTRLVFAWNTMGLALLINIMAVAMLSAPTPFRLFFNAPANVWVTRAPWVWLPTVLVTAALLGHVLTYRALALRRVR